MFTTNGSAVTIYSAEQSTILLSLADFVLGFICCLILLFLFLLGGWEELRWFWFVVFYICPVCVCVCGCVCVCVFSQPAGSRQVRPVRPRPQVRLVRPRPQIRLVRPRPQDKQPTTAVAADQPDNHRCDDTDSPPHPAPS